jgi:hypothetical protein
MSSHVILETDARGASSTRLSRLDERFRRRIPGSSGCGGSIAEAASTPAASFCHLSRAQNARPLSRATAL